MISPRDQVSAPNGRPRRRASHVALLLATTALSSPLFVGSTSAQNVPAGGSVAAGSVTIAQPSATQLNITQSSQSAVVNWQSFSIGQGSTVNIQQPNSSSALLNRVTGSTQSTIAGALTSNGQVYLINPNGIAITSTGVVSTGGGFVASTLGISDADFQSGKRTFTGNGTSAAVSNAGVITVGRGGYAALLGGAVSNDGQIVVPLGLVGLGAGERATLDFSGDGFLQVAVPTAPGGNAALIDSAGSIRADGGAVIISAATARDAARNAVNISGVVEARSIGGRSGSISIGGGAGGDVKISGQVSATSRRGSGGSVTVTGKDIALAGANIDVSGKTGGGTVKIGGDRQGQGSLQRAERVSIDKATVIRADSTAIGNGGNVVVWSDQVTSFEGNISGRGGAQGGNGGQAEVSGKAKLNYNGFTNLSASYGAFGTLLLDPYNVTISNGTGNTSGSYDANTDDSVINAATLQTQLGGAHVTITTGNSGSQAGNITVAAPLSWSAPTTLGLNAAGGIAINAPISITGAGGLTLNATARSGVTTTGLTFGKDGSVDYGATDNGGTFSLNGINYTLIYSMAQFDAIDGINAVDGSSVTIHGDGLTGNYALATKLTATETYIHALAGTNSSEDGDTQFSGRLDGLGNTITGLTIDAAGTNHVGLIGYVAGAEASVSNIGIVGGNVSGQDSVGPLVGWLDLGTVQGSFSSTIATGGGVNIGGLVGFNTGTVQSSSATGSVTGNVGVGGLSGWNATNGVIRNSYATGAVNGATSVGGLTGYSLGMISTSYANGAVTGTTLATGGLVGRTSGGTVTASYATGTVTGVQNTGGLIGTNLGVVETSYATGAVTATNNRTGGLIGQNGGPSGQTATVRASYATGAVSGTTNSGGLVGLNSPTGTVTTSYSTGTVAGTSPSVGGLVGGNNGAAGTITNSYWNILTSSLSASPGGGTGLTTAQLQGTLPANFSSADWSTGAGLYPYLTWQFAAGSTPQAVSGIAYQANGAALSGATIAGSSNGTAFAGTTGTGANGYYYFLLPQGAAAQDSGVFINVSGNAVKANSYVSGAGSSTQQLDLNAGTLSVRTGATALSSLSTDLGAASAGTTASDVVFSTSGGGLTANAATGVSIAASGAFSVDQALVAPNALLLRAAAGATIASTGSLSSPNGNIVLVGSGFTNQAGAGALSTPNGRWLVYSADPANDSRGGLAYDFKQYGAGYGVTLVAQATGNGFLYSVAPTVALGGTIAKTYDGTTSATPAALTLTGIDGDVVASTYATAAYADINAGTGKTVTASGVAITSASNGSAVVYGYSSPTTLSGTVGIIAARAITITADAKSRVYGDANPALTYAVGGSGLVNNDSLSGSLTTGATTASGVGNYGIAQGNITGGSNYAVTYAGANLSVAARAITVTADAKSRVYGDANPALTYAVGGGGLVNNDSLTGSLSTGGTTASGVGTYGIAQGNVTGGSNYAVTYVGADLAVAARAITVTADAKSRVYGDANPALTYAVGGSGLVNNDSLTGILFTNATTTSGVSSYGITQGNVTGGSNYALTYVSANLAVAARAITVTADAKSRIYGDANPALTYAVSGSGLVNNDTLTGSLSTGATTASGVGTYGIAQGNVTGGNNYAVTYVGADLSVAARAITVTADAKSRVYGDANPALTYTIGGSGLVNNDTLTGSLSTGATTASGVGTYGIAEGNVTGGSNYAVTFAGADLSVAARAITVTADAKSRVYGDTNPALTYAVGGSGLVNNDSLTGSLTTNATSASTAGAYAIAQGTVTNAFNPNYAIAYQGASLVVQPTPLLAASPTATPTSSPFIVPNAEAPVTNQSTISLQLDLPASNTIAPLTGAQGRVAGRTNQSTQTAANDNTDDDIVTGSIGPREFKSADGFVYKTLSQYDAAQYSGKVLPSNASENGEATIFTMLLRGATGSSDTPRVDDLYEPGNPIAAKIRVSDGTDLAAMLGKGPVILTGGAKILLLGVAMTERGIVANDPRTGLQVLLSYNAETKAAGFVASILDAKTGAWIKLADMRPIDGKLSQNQLDQFANLSISRFAAVRVEN